jgi:hypothetical protein
MARISIGMKLMKEREQNIEHRHSRCQTSGNVGSQTMMDAAADHRQR